MKSSLVEDARQVALAIDLARHGARLQMLEAVTTLSRERLTRIYRELNGQSPPKGMLPFSVDWFLAWQPNIQASLYIGVREFLTTYAGLRGIDATLRAFKLYLEHCRSRELEPVLSLTRAWALVRFFDAGMLRTAPCTRCGGAYVVRSDDLHPRYVCLVCRPPARAGKTKAVLCAAGQ